jgi:enolase
VRKAVENVRNVLAECVRGRDATRQREIDALLIESDGTPNKAKLGANAILGVSMAVARAAASSTGLPLYAYLGGPTASRLPVPMMNIVNGGKHAANRLDFQEFMIVPHGTPSFSEALRYGAETFQALKEILTRRGLPTAVGDEGGFAPELKGNEQACALIVEAIQAAGLMPGRDVGIALDPAASSFFEGGAYKLSNGDRLDRDRLLGLYEDWSRKFPILSIEDGFEENDWEGHIALTKSLGKRIQLVGDDVYVTNPKFISQGIERRATNAVLIKLNQIGTVSETMRPSR